MVVIWCYGSFSPLSGRVVGIWWLLYGVMVVFLLISGLVVGPTDKIVPMALSISRVEGRRRRCLLQLWQLLLPRFTLLPCSSRGVLFFILLFLLFSRPTIV